MANFNIPDNPEYTDQIRKFETTDPAHADLFNSVAGKLVENDAFLKNAVGEAIEKASDDLEELRQQLEEEIVEASSSIAAGICNTAKGTVAKTVSCEGLQV